MKHVKALVSIPWARNGHPFMRHTPLSFPRFHQPRVSHHVKGWLRFHANCKHGNHRSGDVLYCVMDVMVMAGWVDNVTTCLICVIVAVTSWQMYKYAIIRYKGVERKFEWKSE